MSDTKTDVGTKTDAPVGIGGWLILVVIGLIANPVLIARSLVVDFLPLFTEGIWEQLTTPGTSLYHPLWQPLIIFELAGNVSLIALAIITLAHLFTKSRRTSTLMIVYLAVQATFVVADFFLGEQIPALAAQPKFEEIKDMVRVLISTAIWIPYFCVSKRVKATFVE
jgi:hypothetical protein